MVLLYEKFIFINRSFQLFGILAKVKWFTDGAEYNTNSEMLIWLWSSNLADSSALPLRWLPTKELRAKANKTVVECIAWDSSLNNVHIKQLFGFTNQHLLDNMSKCF